MSLRERSYRTLVVSASEKLNTALGQHLASSPVRFVSSVSAARRAWSERSYDFILVNAPLPDDPGVRFAIDAAGNAGTVVLILIRSEMYDELFDHVVDHGVFVLPRPLNRSTLTAALSWMASARERLRKLEQKSLSVEEKIEEIRLVNRAKWVLMTKLHMDEDQAHRYIGKRAMDSCVSRRRVAEEIIRENE